MEYTIQQKASIWYETTVEADTKEEALQIVQAYEDHGEWEMLLDTVIFEDDFEVMEDN
jgi:hypothetical protein